MLRLLRLLLQILVLIIVVLASALISMRFAIHGREVAVPDFRGKSPLEAERLAFEHGLELSRSDHFYSAVVPAGRIVSQQPDPGTRVRRGWRVQAAESLGPQKIDIPSVLGMSSRAAEINIRRRGLEVGMSAEMPLAGVAPESVIAQTPLPGAQGVASPRVSLLYAVAPPESAYAMPDLSGLTLEEASNLINQSGLKATLASGPGKASPSSVVSGQVPPPGSRVTPGTIVALQIIQGM